MKFLLAVSRNYIGRRMTSTISLPELQGEAAVPVDPVFARAKPFASIPGPRSLPYFGNLLDYRFGKHSLDQVQETIIDRYRKYGPIVKETILGQTFVRVFDPDDSKIIFQNDGKTPWIRPLQESVAMYRKMREFSPGLGGANGDEWYRLRSAVQQSMLRPQAVITYLPFVNEVTDQFIRYIRQKRSPETLEVTNFKKVATKWTLEISAMLVFEQRVGSLSGGATEEWADKFVDANTEIFWLAGVLKFSLPFYRWISTPKWRRLCAAEDFVNLHSRRLVKETIEKLKRGLESKQTDGQRFNYMAYLLSKPELNQEDVYMLSLSLFGDGLTATAPTLIYTLYNLATNPECQEKLYQEISEHVPKNGPIDPSVLNKMTYVKACVKETLRMFPVNIEISRVTQKNIVLGGYQIPAGTPVDINTSLLTNKDVYFEHAKSFIPERWMREEKAGNGGKESHPYKMTPFGFGPRMCAGRRFAEQDLYVALSRLIQNFKISYRYGELGQVYKTLLHPDSTAQFTFVDRE